jgi:hypothetical protein
MAPCASPSVPACSWQRETCPTYLESPGRWMAHCHIPEHAERGMMMEYEVVPDGK